MRFAALLFLFFTGLGGYLSSLSPYAVGRFGEHASAVLLAGQIGYPAGAFLGGWLSDRFQRLRVFLLVGLVALVPAQFLFFTVGDWFALQSAAGGASEASGFALTVALAASFATRFLFAANLQWTNIAVLESAGEAGYGRIRSAGTMGFFCMQAGLWLLTDPAAAAATGLFAEDGALADLRSSQAGRASSFAYFLCLAPAIFVQGRRLSHEVYRFGDALQFLARPQPAAFLALSFLHFFAFQLVDNYLGAFYELQGGMRLVFLGWALAVVIEIPFLWYAARIAALGGVRALFYLACGAGALRFGMLALQIVGAAPVPALYSQLLHGLHFTGYYIGAIYFLKRSAPQRIYGSVYGSYNLIAHSLGAIGGNVTYGWILAGSREGGFLRAALETLAPGADAGGLAFLPLFASAAGLHALLIVGFFLLGEPRAREKSWQESRAPGRRTSQ